MKPLFGGAAEDEDDLFADGDFAVDGEVAPSLHRHNSKKTDPPVPELYRPPARGGGGTRSAEGGGSGEEGERSGGASSVQRPRGGSYNYVVEDRRQR